MEGTYVSECVYAVVCGRVKVFLCIGITHFIKAFL